LWEPDVTRSLAISRHLKGNIKTDLKEIEWEGVELALPWFSSTEKYSSLWQAFAVP
jgi:hypothetical protein